MLAPPTDQNCIFQYFKKSSSKQEAKSKPIPLCRSYVSHAHYHIISQGGGRCLAAVLVFGLGRLLQGRQSGERRAQDLSSPYNQKKDTPHTNTSCPHAPEPSARPRHKHQKEKMRKGALLATRRGLIPYGRVEPVGGRVPNVSHNWCLLYEKLRALRVMPMIYCICLVAI